VRALTTHTIGGVTRLYAGGTFQTAGGVSATHLAAWDGATWSSTGATHAPVHGLSELAVGGVPRLHAATSSRVQRLDGATWTDLGLAGALALGAFDFGLGPQLVAGGSFTTNSTTTAFHVARLDEPVWNALGAAGGGLFGARVHAMTTHDVGAGRTLFAGGLNDPYGSQSAIHR
jgi:hypothetical protein